MGNPPRAPRLTVGVKYCGGCNPGYDRAAVVRRLRGDFPDIAVRPLAHWRGGAPQLVLVLRGCTNPCSNYGKLAGTLGRVELDGPGQYARLTSFISSFTNSLLKETAHMDYRYLTCTVEQRIATITITRERELNALNSEVIDELRACLEAISAGSEAGAVILTGAGRAFVAGADIAQMRDMPGCAGRDHTKRGQDLMDCVESCELPVIAAVNGFALGGGCELAMACDIRIASTGARFGQPEVTLGIIPGFGGTQRLPRLVGKGQAKYMIMTGEMIDGAEAYRIGLVQKLTEPEDLMDEARRVAALILAKSPLAVRVAKCAVNAAQNTDLASGIAYEREAFHTAFQGADRAEGMSAFLEKRPANFGRREEQQ